MKQLKFHAALPVALRLWAAGRRRPPAGARAPCMVGVHSRLRSIGHTSKLWNKNSRILRLVKSTSKLHIILTYYMM